MEEVLINSNECVTSIGFVVFKGMYKGKSFSITKEVEDISGMKKFHYYEGSDDHFNSEEKEFMNDSLDDYSYEEGEGSEDVVVVSESYDTYFSNSYRLGGLYKEKEFRIEYTVDDNGASIVFLEDTDKNFNEEEQDVIYESANENC